MKNIDFQSIMLGTAVGDAFLFGIEFQSREWIHKTIDFTKYVTMLPRSDKFTGYKPGDYSDDTEHTIGVGRALVDPRPFSEELLLEFWKDEYEKSKSSRNGIGRAGHGSIKHWYEGESTLDEIRDWQIKKENPGNAPVMRAALIGLVPPEILDEYAIINANATHPHPRARAASIVVARAAEYLWDGGDQSNIIAHCREYVQNVDYETFIYLGKIDRISELGTFIQQKALEIICGRQPMFFKGKEVYGLPCSAMHTAGAALYILKHAKDPFDGLKRAAYMGGDIDSLGAIVVGILGGRDGIESLPKFMIEQVEGKERLEQVAENLKNIFD